ncbi:hypothetical protein ACJMK2_010510 [Sinanodonta woodiana]|uniref:Retinitis pigmentosa 9 protein n=1 Tax=Sinanodonta woodiana TaxID=1069815 RepID=A0ABD3VFL5_SINWO
MLTAYLEDVERSEDHIPDLSKNEETQRFLSKKPTKSFSMTAGKELKDMQCWHCKGYGHRRGDKNCPKFKSASIQTTRLKWSYEDPMYRYIEDNKRREKEKRIQQLQALLISSTDSSESEVIEKSERKKSKKKKKKRKSTEPISKCQERQALYFQGTKTSHSDTDSKHKGHKRKRNDSDCLEKEIHSKRHKKHKHSSKEKRPYSPSSVKSDQDKKTVKKKKKKRHK